MSANLANKTSMVTLKSQPLILNPKLAKKLTTPTKKLYIL